MIRGKRIISYILFALLLIVSNDPAFYSPVTTTPPPFFNAMIRVTHTMVSPAHYASARSVKKEKAKVRYMTGDCSYSNDPIPLRINGIEFADHVKGKHYVSVITANHPFLFKLRGPPVFLS